MQPLNAIRGIGFTDTLSHDYILQQSQKCESRKIETWPFPMATTLWNQWVSMAFLGPVDSAKHPVPEQRVFKWPLLRTVPLNPLFQVLQSEVSTGSGILVDYSRSMDFPSAVVRGFLPKGKQCQESYTTENCHMSEQNKYQKSIFIHYACPNTHSHRIYQVVQYYTKPK